MAVFFKTGKFMTKKYEHLCPGEIIYLNVGKYILDLEKDALIYRVNNSTIVDMREVGAIPFYISLDVDFGRDKKIPLTLDRGG